MSFYVTSCELDIIISNIFTHIKEGSTNMYVYSVSEHVMTKCGFDYTHHIEAWTGIKLHQQHCNDVIMTTMASQITILTVVYSTVYLDAHQRKHQSSASLAFVWGIHRDRWIPRTKGQLRGKCFHLMTSSWCRIYLTCWQKMAKNIHIF